MSVIIPVAIVSGLGLFFGVGLSIASKVFEVKVDERIEKVREMLPGANCGACGFSGCDGLAEAIVNEGVAPDRCPVGGASMVKQISGFMGIASGEVVEKEARVMCDGRFDNIQLKYKYEGIEDCHAANLLSGGAGTCNFGCLGLGSCKAVCPFDAIVIENGVARIISEKCTGCGKCVEECPKHIIHMVPVTSGFTVFCSNKDKGAVARKACKVACIGCRMCVKACPSDAITVSDFLAVIDPEKCTNCGECAKVCPQKCISDSRVRVTA
ncbi:MAG: RnfABCDGE type electron transport complex subunit B [Clostridiaceae bacterium]|nr:RnfABCDGE type electron transport complex subunit B [Clostridiaceae bacterium]